MCAGLFLVQLDVTVVNVALPSLRDSLGAAVGGLQWVVDGYAIALASLMLPAGTLGDRYGHRRMVLAGLAIFGAGSLGCGLAPGTGALVAARALQGAGAALLLPGTLAIVTRTFPGERERARAIGAWAAVSGLALPAGPLVGGALVEASGWRAVFLINVPIVAPALVATLRVVPADRGSHARPLDVPGMVLGAAALALITFALIEAQPLAGLAALGVLGAFLVVERRSEHPMLPLALFRRPRFSAANAIAGAMNLGTLGTLFVLTLYLQTVQGRSPLEAGLATVPAFGMLTLIAPLGGRLTGRIGPRVPMAAGLTVSAAGLLLLTQTAPDTPYAQLVPAFVLWGGGLGLLTPAVVAAAMGAVEPERSGLAAAVNNTARQAGGAIGIAAFGALAAHGVLQGLHEAALIAAALYLVAAVATGLPSLRWSARTSTPARARPR
jgi:DHA2 family methylenomycin A resistance protein-like MFS transporter